MPRPHAQAVPTHTDAALPVPSGPSGHSSPLLASLPIPGRPLHSPLDIKHFLTFRLNGTSPLNLFPNFNTVSARGWGASAVGHLLPCISSRTLFQCGRVISGLIPGQHTCAMCPSIGANAEPEWGEGAAVMTPPPSWFLPHLLLLESKIKKVVCLNQDGWGLLRESIVIK